MSRKGFEKYLTGGLIPVENLNGVIVDIPTEKPLSEIVTAIEALLKPYNFELDVSFRREAGTVKSMEITARIQVRR